MANLTENFNYLQPTSFKLVLDRRNYPNLEFFCQSITHPGMILNPVELGIPRLSGIPIAGESLTFNELSTNIILDEKESVFFSVNVVARKPEKSAPETNP